MATAYELIKKTFEAAHFGWRHAGTTTATGTTSTAVDGNLAQLDKAPPDSWLIGGTLLLNDQPIATRIDGWTQATGTFTMEVTLGAASGINNEYMAFDERISLDEIQAALNAILLRLPRRDLVDTSLTTADDTECYDLPTNGIDISQVWIASNTAEPYKWKENKLWYIRNDGTNDQLCFEPSFYPNVNAGYPIKLVYRSSPSTFWNVDDTEVLSDLYNPDWIANEAAVHILSAKDAAYNGKNQIIRDRLLYARAMSDNLKSRMANRVHKARRSTKYSVWSTIER